MIKKEAIKFPIDLTSYKQLQFNISQESLTKEQEKQLKINIQLIRDAIVFMTAYSNAKGYGGHTGGAYDIVPEVLIIEAFKSTTKKIHSDFFDEAGHRVAIQYVLSVLYNQIPPEKLLYYREHAHGLYGHPEINITCGATHSSGRLGHSWGFVNGIAEQNPDKQIILFGSDGSQMEGTNAESARYAVANNLNVLLLIDDNNVTIEDNTENYMSGFDLQKTLQGHGLKTTVCDAEDLNQLYNCIQKALEKKGPVAIINKRKMCPNIKDIEGTPKGHDAISKESAIDYLKNRGHKEAIKILQETNKTTPKNTYLGSTSETGKNRDIFGKTIIKILDNLPKEEQKKNLIISNDLGDSCGLSIIQKNYPELYRLGGPMERHNFLAAGGFGSKKGYQGIFGTFSAFIEMIISEETMNRLNNSNILAHFSHAGVDDMSDNTCHFGINNFFADNGLSEEDNTRLYFPADPLQMQAIVKKTFYQPGLRFIFSTRSSSPYILNENGERFFDPENNYEFKPDKDEIIREGTAGYIISYGSDLLYRALDAVEQLKKQGIDAGLINKPTLNVIDHEMMHKIGKAPFILVIESQNKKTGLGSRFATDLMKMGYSTRYDYMGIVKPGQGGMGEQIDFQNLNPEGIISKVKELIEKK